MSIDLTSIGIQKFFSLSGEDERVPITLQVLEVHQPTPNRIEVQLSDGVHFCHMTLPKRLHALIQQYQVCRGAVLRLNNYITQPLDEDKLVAICLDASLVSSTEFVIGDPSEFIPISQMDNLTKDFVGNSNGNLCEYCKEEPCDWNLYGPTTVQSVRCSHGSTRHLESISLNKTSRFHAYGMYARVKFGYLGKGIWKPLPTHHHLFLH
jgi:hypothetical protein